MQCQIEQMKSSIANIQQSLRRLEHEDAERIDEQNILPQSIIHQHPRSAPMPTPKITDIVPNITRTQKYTPARHHLDDTQMKKALKYQECSAHTKKQKRKQKSNNIKTKYIYDGARVVYVPVEAHQPYNQYDHLFVESDRIQNQQPFSYSQNDKTGYYFTDQTKYRAETERNHANIKTKNKWRPQEKQQKMKKVKSSQRNAQTSAYLPNDYDKTTEKLVIKSRKMKSIKVQCKIAVRKKKQPFIMDWDANTDSQFSDMEI